MTIIGVRLAFVICRKSFFFGEFTQRIYRSAFLMHEFELVFFSSSGERCVYIHVYISGGVDTTYIVVR